MQNISVDDKQYIVTKNYKNGFDLDKFKERYTDYFDNYDYILGDWAYGKLRLKGFCEKNNKQFNDINDIDNLDNYILTMCANDCAYFVLKRKM